MRILQFLGCMIFLFFAQFLQGTEAHPQFFHFTIKNHRLIGTHFESALTPQVKSELFTDTLIVKIETQLQGEGSCEVQIPLGVTKLRLFDCEFELPPAEKIAYIQTFPLIEVNQPWWNFWKKDENQCALLLFYFNEEYSEFKVQLFYRGQAGDEVWTSAESFELKITPDLKIISRTPHNPFYIKDNKLYINLEVKGKYYNYLKKDTCEILLPRPLN